MQKELKKGSGDNPREKPNGSDAAAATITRPIATTGEVFPDGRMIELIGGVHDGNPALMLWDGERETVGSLVEHNGRFYEPVPIDSSVLQALTLPTCCRPHGSTHEFFAETSKLVANYVGLPEKSASLVGRLVLCSALIEAVSVAPALVIVGPDIARGNRLVALLHCLCRHSLHMTGVTPAGLCSLPSGARFTYLLNQSSVSDRLRKLLDDVSSRDRRIPFRGRLLDLFGVQVIHCESMLASDSSPLRSIQVSMIPTGQELPVFDLNTQDRIAIEFQAKLLSFRRANLGAARRLQFDASKFTFALRDLARGIAAATPDDAELQAEVFDLLREHDAEIRSERWTELSSVAVEAVLVAGHESRGGVIYVADLAEIAQEILRRRGETETEINPAMLGKMLKILGFTTERDAEGKKLLLTDARISRATQLARDFGSPEVEEDGPVNTRQQG